MSATDFYRNIFDRRTAGQLRTLSHVKRFMERLLGDKAFVAALLENVDNSRTIAERYGIEVDPVDILPLWHKSYAKYREEPEGAAWPVAAMWLEYQQEMIDHRDMLREESKMAMVIPRFQTWRKRQIRRCDGELGASAKSITHPALAFELSDGCTGKCSFCGVSAGPFNGYYEYNKDHAMVWRGVVGVASEMFGSAARTGFCYHATEPMDNPDYDRFLQDYYQITSALPQTTTAAPLKDQPLTRRVLDLFKRHRCVPNRFSVPNRDQLDQIHSAFSPEDLMGVELVLQGKDAGFPKAMAGRAREQKFRAENNNDAIAGSDSNHTTIACVSGFLVNMPRGEIRLVTPVPGSERWPLGYRIVEKRPFKTVDEFKEGIQRIIDDHMHESPLPNQLIRFRRDLKYEAGKPHFHLRSRNVHSTVADNVAPISLGDIIASGDHTAAQLVARAVTNGSNVLSVASWLDAIFVKGLIEEDLDDRFAYQTSEGSE
ncbi:radical SAM family RiPP maturation amino acid epimerase [Rhizobium laguerreae]|uniref:radical SAM family RiPP maturation amino acid epimerase n=1 Tax=Rhizobium laguerreae TaxID=1076926 RepID=UPI001479559D|nr:radical SAM family RiPP maturation amino acid epimerase [Rhizobium laguerreae]NNH57349.1 radical SAM family RiPP maturation amino acid epimerase [Rhizobium laguerreae]